MHQTSVLPTSLNNYIGKTLENPQRPFVGIIGGAKVSDKIGVISNMIDKVDTIIIGGGMAHTFDKAKGYEVGTSLLEADKVELAKELLEKAEKKGVKVVLPVDLVVANKFAADAEFKTVPVDQCPADWMGLDSGEKTSEEYVKALEGAKTIIWNGPMGVFEFDNFAKGTLAVAKAVADATEKGAISIVGGGDSIVVKFPTSQLVAAQRLNTLKVKFFLALMLLTALDVLQSLLATGR